MSASFLTSFSCFDGYQHVETGSLSNIALMFKQRQSNGRHNPVRVFDNASGRTIDIDIRGTDGG